MTKKTVDVAKIYFSGAYHRVEVIKGELSSLQFAMADKLAGEGSHGPIAQQEKKRKYRAALKLVEQAEYRLLQALDELRD